MTYSTPALLVRAGQGVFFFFFLGCTWLSWRTHGHPWSPDWCFRCKTRGLQHFFSGLKLCQLIFLTFELLLQALQLTSHNWPQVLHLLAHLLPLLFSLTSLLCQAVPLMTMIFHVFQHLLCLCHEGSGNDRAYRTTQGHRGRGLVRLQEGNWHKERISLKLCQKPLLPEPVPPPLTGTFVLVTPIELHGDLKHIITFYGGCGIGF